MIHRRRDTLTAVPLKVRIRVLAHERIIDVPLTQHTKLVPVHHCFVLECEYFV